MQLIQSQGWEWRQASSPNIELEKCPYCKHLNFHLRMEIHGASDELKQRDGLHSCMRCGKSGNLRSLKEHLGLVIPGVESKKDYSSSEKKIEAMPDIEAMHEALLANADGMDYLMNVRGFSRDIIIKQKLGLTKRYFRETGEVNALVFPYLVNGNSVFVHFRTLPDVNDLKKVPKAFSSLTGWDVPLYNGEILKDGLKEVVMAEGECDVIAALDKGLPNMVGSPGANFKKAQWIDTLDSIGIEKVYICYDKDKVGQKAAQTLATRIGIEKCYKIILPDFEVETESGDKRKGKDLNEWFTQGGGSAEEFEKLKNDALLFDVDGVSSSKDAVQEFMDELEGKEGLQPKYQTAWPSLNKLVGFEEGDCIDILAPEKIGKSTIALNLLEHMVDTYGEDGAFICLEMSRARMARKWVSHMAQVADNIPKSVEEGIELANQFKAKIPEVMAYTASRQGDLYFCYPIYKTKDDIYNLMRDIIRRYGVKWIVIDNIQRLADTTPSGNKGRTQHLSEISKETSQIGKDYGVQIVRILQPHRIAEGKAVSTDNVDGASQIAKDCDCMLTAHRTRLNKMSANDLESCGVVNEEGGFGDQLFLGVGLSRYSSGGMCTLFFDGARSTVRELNEVQTAKILAVANKDVGHEAQLAKLGIKPKDTVQNTQTSTQSSVGIFADTTIPMEGEITI